jgi:DNA invertase Pin-like site-specific DNA recombinase
MDGKYVSYLRVSTARQGASGLGLEAQRASVEAFLNGGAWTLLREFVEIESGRKSDRPQLSDALLHCRRTGATLVIAKLDRLARDAHFLLGLQKAGVDFIAADMPAANRLTIGIMALVAEEEARAISARTKSALAAAKARGVKLGGYRAGAPLPDGAASIAARRAAQAAYAREVGPMAASLRAEGKSLRQIAAEMVAKEIRTPAGGAWSAAAVSRLLAVHDAMGA